VAAPQSTNSRLLSRGLTVGAARLGGGHLPRRSGRGCPNPLEQVTQMLHVSAGVIKWVTWGGTPRTPCSSPLRRRARMVGQNSSPLSSSAPTWLCELASKENNPHRLRISEYQVVWPCIFQVRNASSMDKVRFWSVPGYCRYRPSGPNFGSMGGETYLLELVHQSHAAFFKMLLRIRFGYRLGKLKFGLEALPLRHSVASVLADQSFSTQQRRFPSSLSLLAACGVRLPCSRIR